MGGPPVPRPRSSFLVFFSLSLSLMALCLSAVSLLMVHDYLTRQGGTREAAKKPAEEWSWEGSLDRVQKYLESAYAHLTKRDEKSGEAADRDLNSLRDEIARWREKAEPRLKEALAEFSKQAEEARTAVRARSAAAAEKLTTLRDSLQAFREKVAPTKPEAAEKKNKSE